MRERKKEEDTLKEITTRLELLETNAGKTGQKTAVVTCYGMPHVNLQNFGFAT